MKQQRRTAEEGREHLLSVMREVHAQVAGQSEFTAQRVADAAGVSTVWLYKLAGEEFRALRAQLPGSRKTRDEEVAALRQENVRLHMQLEEARMNKKMGEEDPSLLRDLQHTKKTLEEKFQELIEELHALKTGVAAGSKVQLTLPSCAEPLAVGGGSR